MLVEHRDRRFGAAHFRAGAGRGDFDDLRFHSQRVTGINGLQPAQFVQARGAEPGLLILL